MDSAEIKVPGRAIAISMQHAVWQQIYDKYFGDLKVDVPAFDDVEGKIGIYVAEGLTCDMVYAAWAFNKFNCMEATIDDNLNMQHEARSGIGSYLVRVKNGTEPDSPFLGKSTFCVDMHGTIGITLKERMLLELIHRETTGQIIDAFGVTFCSGSRYFFDDVPSVCFGRDGYVCVYRYGLDESNSRFGIREAVLEPL